MSDATADGARSADDGASSPRNGSTSGDGSTSGRGVAGFDRTDPVDVEARPSRLGTGLALLSGVVAVTGLLVAGPAAVVGLLGLAVLGLGLRRASAGVVSAGGAVLFGGVLLAGVLGTPPEALLVAAAATVVAWDVADNAVSVGEQLGRAADARRAELVHAAASALVACVTAGLAYLVFRASRGATSGASLAALALVTLGALLLATLLR